MIAATNADRARGNGGKILRTWRRVTTSTAFRWAAIGLSVAAVLRVYWFIGSANKSGEWPIYMNYYDLLADAFRSGHLYVAVEPNPALLRQPNPYDPAHVSLWFWDVSLHRGRYYMYWGPVPALLQALAKSVLGITRMIGDQYLVFSMCSLSALSGALLIERLQRRLFPSVSLGVLVLAILAFGLANPAPHLVASGGVYQASIAAAQAFLLLGLVFAFDAVWVGQMRRPKAYRFLLIGTIWALALGSRVSSAPAIALLAIGTCLASNVPGRGFAFRNWLPAGRALLFVALPLCLGLALLLAYNKARFDSYLEFGTNMQLSTLKFRVSTDYWLVNTYTYLLRPFKAACEFPYVTTPSYPPAKEALAGWMGVPDGYLLNEPVVGWLRVVVISWFIPIAVWVGYKKIRAFLGQIGTSSSTPGVDVVILYCLASFTVLSTVTGLVLLGLYMATMRYLGDVTNGLALLGIFGAFWLCAGARRTVTRLLAQLLSAAALLATIGFGLLLGYQSYTGHFKQFNPQLHARLQNVFPKCDEPPTPPGRHSKDGNRRNQP